MIHRGDDFVFAGGSGMPLNPDALSSRYDKALEAGGLRRLRFHDLRHTVGTRMIREADIRRVQEWMGHTDIQTTTKYLHYESRKEDAELVARALATGRCEPGETLALEWWRDGRVDLAARRNEGGQRRT